MICYICFANRKDITDPWPILASSVHTHVLICTNLSRLLWLPLRQTCKNRCPAAVPFAVTGWGEALRPTDYKFPSLWNNELTIKRSRENTRNFDPKVLLNPGPFTGFQESPTSWNCQQNFYVHTLFWRKCSELYFANWQTSSLEVPIVSVLGFAGHVVSAAPLNSTIVAQKQPQTIVNEWAWLYSNQTFIYKNRVQAGLRPQALVRQGLLCNASHS